MRSPIPTLLVVAVLVIPATLGAQVSDPTPTEGPTVALDWTKPFLDGGDFGFATSTLVARSLLPLGDRVRLLADLGLSHARGGGESSTTLSNLEVGVVLVDDEVHPVARFTVVAPTATGLSDDESAMITGLFTDPVRPERFVSDVWALNALYTPGSWSETRSMGFRLGASALLPDAADTELYARYGGWVEHTGDLRLGAELAGQVLVTEGDLDFGERTLHQVTLTVGFGEGPVRPDAFLRLPLDEDVRELVDVVVGLRLTF